MTLKEWLTVASLIIFPTSDRRATAGELKTSEKILQMQIDVNAGPAEIWHAWTTPDGVAGFFAPGCKIELEPGGAYEIYFMPDQPPGKRGAEGSQVLSYLPNELLAFTWGAPPAVMKLREAGAMTQVVLRFEPLSDGRTRVHFAQLGFGDGEDWDKYYAYFENAWPRVLSNLQKKFADRKSPAEPAAALAAQQSTNGHVKVSTSTAPLKRQDFEMTVPVSVEKLWNALATTDGLKSLGGSDPLVELKPGGRYAFWPQAPNKVMAFVPKQVLATTGSAPPKFPNVRKGGTWGVYFFEPLAPDKTRLRLSVIGWKQGEEWDRAFDYFIRNNPIFLNNVYKQVTQEKAASGEILRHEAVVNAPIAQVWNALTTKDGIESWMVAHADINLRVGGVMRTNYNPKGVLGDDGTIENTILSYEPQRMLSIKATRAPAGFPFKDEIADMWTVIYLDPQGDDKTRVSISGMGFRDDEASQKMRAHFDWGNAYTLKKLQEHFSTTAPAQPSAAANAASQ